MVVPERGMVVSESAEITHRGSGSRQHKMDGDKMDGDNALLAAWLGFITAPQVSQVSAK